MILQSLYKAGLIQFGNFEDVQGIKTVKYSLEYLPSYPQLLLEIATAIKVDAENYQYDYILAKSGSISLGTLVGYLLQYPVVFENITGSTPANRIIGSYDTGHPTILITNTVDEYLEQLVSDADKVGLEVEQIISIVGGDMSVPSYPIRTLISEAEIDVFSQSVLS